MEIRAIAGPTLKLLNHIITNRSPLSTIILLNIGQGKIVSEDRRKTKVIRTRTTPKTDQRVNIINYSLKKKHSKRRS